MSFYDPSSTSSPYFAQSLSPYPNTRQLPQRVQPKASTNEEYDWEYMAMTLREEMRSMTEHMRMTRMQWKEEREQWREKLRNLGT